MNYLIEGKTKLTGDKTKIKTLGDFESAILEAKDAGQPYSIKHSQDGCSYRALARKIGDGLKHGRWDYEDKAVANIDAMIDAYGRETVHGWAMNEFLTDGDDQATRGEKKGRVSKEKVVSTTEMAGGILQMLKLGIITQAQVEPTTIAMCTGKPKEFTNQVLKALGLDTEIA